MKAPIKLFVLLPDGRELPVLELDMEADGTVNQLVALDKTGAFFCCNGLRLDQCRLIAKANGFNGNVEYWSEPA